MSDLGVGREQLRAFFERWERLEEEKKAISDDLKDLFSEMKGNGFDTKVARKVFRDKLQDPHERAEFEAIYDVYMHALGGPRAGRAREEVEVTTSEPSETEAFDPETGELVTASEITESGLAGQSSGVCTGSGARPADESASPVHELRVTEPVLLAGERDVASAPEGSAGNEMPSKTSQEAAGPAKASQTPPRGPVSIGGDDRGNVFDIKPKSSLRPHCQRPDKCAGMGSEHCYSCAKAMQGREGVSA